MASNASLDTSLTHAALASGVPPDYFVIKLYQMLREQPGAIRWHYSHNMWPPIGREECKCADC